MHNSQITNHNEKTMHNGETRKSVESWKAEN